MSEQSNAAAERSAHVTRGSGRTIPGETFLIEVTPGVFQLKALVERDREIARLRAQQDRLRRAWLRVIQAENSCPASGGGCFTERCGCLAEMELLIGETGHE